MTLANRLNLIIEKKISKREFAKRVGISENYVYTLTCKNKKITTLSPMLARVIAMEFGYDAEWNCTEIINSKRLPQKRCAINGCGAFVFPHKYKEISQPYIF